METEKGLFRKVLMIFTSLFIASSLLLADGVKTEVYLSGDSNSPAGLYVVQITDDVYQFQGRIYEVYQVNYDDPRKNMKIAVNMEGKCRSFVAYNEEFSFFYNCNKFGFGVRKVMFDNPWVHKQFQPEKYQQQSILMCDKVIDKRDAIQLIACYVPMLYRGGQ